MTKNFTLTLKDYNQEILMQNLTSFIDLVDSQGVVRKTQVPKTQSRDFEGLYAQVVIVVVFDELGRVLVHKRRSSKEVNPGDIDFVCGMVENSESPFEAAMRETKEETGLTPKDLQLVHQGVNSYGRYRYLFTGIASGYPIPQTDHEVEWVAFLSRNQINKSGRVVDEFFDDLAKVDEFVARSNSA
jgi:8-oxo-dGTP pyrophosphatase MutT (NUDIX family)